MKRILFDIISLQDYHNGGEEYVRAILKSLLESHNVEIIGLYDSKLRFLDDDYINFNGKFKLIDIQNESLSEIISKEKIDTFFIGIGQRYSFYNLNGINCRTICVVHDIGNIEFSLNKIHYLFPKSLKQFINLCLDYWMEKYKYSFSSRIKSAYEPLINFIKQPNVELITVSNYTANSIKFYFPELKDKDIRVFYPPVKNYKRNDNIDNPFIQRLLSESHPYLLLLNISRENKNGHMILKAFQRIKLDFPELRLVVTGAPQEIFDNNILYLKYISNSDMENLYRKAWALIYPSYTEGFGYPPVEAMKYGTPVLAANVCSMPEILGNAAIYFSPFYANDFSSSLHELKNRYEKTVNNCNLVYTQIHKKQISDTIQLTDIIKG